MGKQDERKTLEAGETVETVQQKFCSRLSPRHAPGYAGHVKMTYTLLMHHSPCKKQFSELPPNDIFVMIIRASGIFLLIRIAMED